ncbi:MAG: protein kinase [Acidobacteriota bacterium]
MTLNPKTENLRGGDSPIKLDSPLPKVDTARAKAGDRVGRFRIVEVIGSGGMGIVYKALDEALGRHVALKHPRSDVKDAETVRARFVREARAASRLLHPNVVPIFEVFEFEDTPWLAMELVEGGSLKNRLKGTGPLPLLEVLGHGMGLAGALAAAHELDILHRDLKPANVLLDAEGRARLVDFGLARRLVSKDRGDEETITRLTEQGHMVGTPGYMSPEQALGRSLDARSDIFCLGLVLYEMATGTPAVEKAGSDSWLDSLLHSPPTPIVHFRPDTPEVLADIVRKALAKKPEDRYQSAEAMASDLRELRSEVEGGLVRAKVLRSRLQRRLLQALGLAVLAAAASAGTWWLKDIVAPETLATNWVAKPLTHDPAWAADPALSPDETMIAYASGRSGSGDIWLIDREGGNALQLTDHEAADRRPAWSADGSEIYFTSFRSGEAAIWKVPRLGGAAELVLPDADDPALSSDGTQLAFVRRDDSGHYRVAIAPLDDLKDFRHLTTSEDGFWYHRNPDFSPDGTRISYEAGRGLWIVQVDGGRPLRLTFGNEPIGEAVWSGESIIFSRPSFGVTALWRLDPGGGSPERLTAGAGFENQVSPSADGRTIIYSTQRSETWLNLINHLTGVRIRLGDVLNPDMASMAPDGSAVAFSAKYREGYCICLQPLHEGQPAGSPRVLIAQPGTYANPVFSPDGRWLAFHRVIGDQRDIWTLPVEGGAPLQFTTNDAADVSPFFSGDGTHLAFASDRSGRFQIWWAPVADGRRMGEAERLTFEETTDYMPKISPDGSMLVWLGNRDDEENLWVRSLTGPTAGRPLTEGRRISNFWWEPGSSTLLASGDWKGDALSLRRISVLNGSIMTVDIPVDFGRGETGGTDFASGAISLSSDGRYSVHTQTELTGDLWIMDAESKDRLNTEE